MKKRRMKQQIEQYRDPSGGQTKRQLQRAQRDKGGKRKTPIRGRAKTQGEAAAVMINQEVARTMATTMNLMKVGNLGHWRAQRGQANRNEKCTI